MQKTLHHPLFEGCIYRDNGHGFPVVLIHGFPEDGTVFSSQESALLPTCRLIIPDLPGSGGSPLSENITIESMADLIGAILAEENIDQCIVIGHSMGGYITLALAEKYPDRIKGFGFFHSTALADSDSKKQVRRRAIDFISKHGAASFVKQMMPGLFSPSFKEEHPGTVEKLVRHSQAFRPETLIAYEKAMLQRPDRTGVLQRSVVPVLFIAGKDDPVIPMEEILPQAHLPGIAAIHIFEKTGHMGMVENPAVINPALESFIAFCLSMDN